MPLPLFFIVSAAASAGVGLVKTMKAKVDNDTASSINEIASLRIETAKNSLEISRNFTGEVISKLGAEKLYVLNNSINRFLSSFEKIKNVNLTESPGLDEFSKICIDKTTIKDLRDLSDFATTLTAGSITGVASGAIAAFGAYSAATTFATASTGTAIASLSGAAASNATLAFFGGGSLAAGGLGIAGGTAVLGGLVAGPALLVMGLVTGAKASKNLNDAYSNDAESQKISEELLAATDLCDNISRRTIMFYNILARLDSHFLPAVFNLEKVLEEEGFDYSKYSSDAKYVVAKSATLASTIKAVLDTAILNEDGTLTNLSKLFGDKMYTELQNNHYFIDAF